MSDTKSTSFVLTKGSIELLVSIITQPGWTTRRSDVVAAGRVAGRIEENVLDRPIYTGQIVNGQPASMVEYSPFKQATRVWERTQVEFTLSDSEFQACVAALKHFTDEKRVPSNFHGNEILTVFKLTE
jgi:hypothetical protein